MSALSGKFVGEKRVPTNTVNLDALIPRDDFVATAGQVGGSPRNTIAVSDLAKNGFFQNNLRKPDFQRETTHWTPSKVVDLVKAFLDRDLIPAVILWERGDETFVIDGAHRLSALIAWVRDDYGDGNDSNRFFGAGITDEQRSVGEKTRKLIKKEIGPYAEYAGLVGQQVADPLKARRLASLGKEALIIQWVTAATAEAAEASFFKINQAAQPIDPVERRILQSRTSPNAIAARCITRGGRGHKYWASFELDVMGKIEELGAKLYDDLYKPPHSQPVNSADQPIAGQGYNALPFVFDLVSLCNGLRIPATASAKLSEDQPPSDMDGGATVKMLENVNERIRLISTDWHGSLGLHPLVYYYARSGTFLPSAFLGGLEFAKRLDDTNSKKKFTSVRRRFEDYIIANKVFVSLTVTRLGSGSRSLGRIAELYWRIFQAMHKSQSDDGLLQELISDDDFAHLKLAEIPPPNATKARSARGASRETKSAAYIREALANPVRCSICTGIIHKNSISWDHGVRVSEGGDSSSDNISPTHPFCNTGFKG
jgi:Protein of unknown function DUF262